MAESDSTRRYRMRHYSLVAVLLLSGCLGMPNSSFDIPFTGIVVPQSDFATAGWVTTAEVTLRAGQDDEARPVALLPRGTPLVPIGIVGAECDCWKVDSPAGSGWLYTRYIASRSSEALE